MTPANPKRFVSVLNYVCVTGPFSSSSHSEVILARDPKHAPDKIFPKNFRDFKNSQMKYMIGIGEYKFYISHLYARLS